jgi:hypothetical protein
VAAVHARLIAALPVAGVAGCSTVHYSPPAPFPARERQLAADLVEAERAASCDVRLLGTDGATSYVWGECRYPDGSQVSTPFRLRNGHADSPGDGSAYGPSVHRLFPEAMARVVLADPDRLRP